MSVTFYDSSGVPVAYSQDDKHIFLFSGEAVAYIYKDSLYSFFGVHLGWYLDGWVRDHDGSCVFFTEDSKGGPMKPMKKMKPMKDTKQMKPMKGMKQMKPTSSSKKSSWSPLSGNNFFE